MDLSFAELVDAGVDNLTPYGTVIRYPDDFYIPDMQETGDAVRLAVLVEKFIMGKLDMK